MSAPLLHEDRSLSQTTSPPPVFTRNLYWSPRMLCLTTKPVIVILLWVFVVACVLRGIQYTSIIAVNTITGSKQDVLFIYMACCYAFMTLVAVSYPIGGFLADVYCGRYRVVVMSMAFIWIALFFLGIALMVTFLGDHSTINKHSLNVPRNVFLCFAFVVIIPGLSGFFSNMIQLSLDQLQDAPSHTLGILLHWWVWVDLLGESVLFVMYVIFAGCSPHQDKSKDILKTIGYAFNGGMFTLLSILLPLSCFTKRWFYAADIRYNPYKMVVDVLKYVRTHKYPIRHSAMHWTNGERPSRFDFAKDCYGGPFSSSQVEDVKTLGRVVLVLLAVGPVFVLCVPTSYLIFPFFSSHTAGPNNCSPETVLIKSGMLSYLIGLLALPVITWVVYCVLKNRVPKILTRLEVGIILFIIGVFSMLVIELVGSSVTKDTSHCLFSMIYSINNTDLRDTKPQFNYGFSWYVLIIPNCFSVISHSLILVTLLEFISAQAPQPMKGLVFGVFFAIKGIFMFLATVLLVPFSLESTTTSLSPYISCGSSYFFLTLLVSLVGLVLFACVRRWYKYRMRDEEPFSQAVVEEIFERRLQHNAEESLLESPDIMPGSCEGSVAVRRSVRESEEERVRASEWFTASGEDQSRGGGQERLLSLSHDWYGTFQYNDSERRTC